VITRSIHKPKLSTHKGNNPMNVKKLIATTAIGAVLASGAAVAIASPASANDQSPLQAGSILWFNTVGPLASQTPATQIFGGTDASVVGAWKTLTTSQPCPAGSAQLTTFIRIPQGGVAEDLWDEVQLGANTVIQDAAGRFYTSVPTQADRISKPQVMAYQAAHPGANQFPIVAVCGDADGFTTGSFRNVVTMTGTTSATLAWTIDSTPIVDSRAVSTTTLAASSTSTTVGDSVTLTATVAPASSSGSVEFFAGATSLGTGTLAGGIATKATTALPVGTASVTAVYAGDTANKPSTSAPVSIVVASAPATATTTTLAVDIVTGAPNQDVHLTATVAPAAAGNCDFYDGTVLKANVAVVGGVAAYHTNSFGSGAHSFTAVFVPADPTKFVTSTSTATTATYTPVGVFDDQTVVVTIPVGTITLTTPYTPDAPLNLGEASYDAATSTYYAQAPFANILINDTRAGAMGFTASVVAGDFVNADTTLIGDKSFGGQYAGLTDLVATQLPNNRLHPADMVLTDRAPVTPGLALAQVFATHAAGLSIGSTQIDGVFKLAQIPTSVAQGKFTSTVTFSVI
jgi:Bacterial Ig-like domain (group 3)